MYRKNKNPFQNEDKACHTFCCGRGRAWLFPPALQRGHAVFQLPHPIAELLYKGRDSFDTFRHSLLRIRRAET